MAAAQLTANAHFTVLARYNRGANERVYQACRELSDEERRADRGAFFRSIHATLNHILVGDRTWLARFEGGSAPSTNLDAILYDDFASLWHARCAEDDRIDALVAGLSPAMLESEIEYVNNEGRLFRDPVRMLLIHFFNHQTHHRGQVHAMLTQTRVEAPVLDLHRVVKPDPN